MLVLSRKIGEEIMIGDGVFLQVVDIAGNRVRLGIRAPKSTPIVRGELLLSDEHVADLPCNICGKIKTEKRMVGESNYVCREACNA